MKVNFPNGVSINANGIAARDTDGGWRTFGLYCDAAWKPDWPAQTIDWPDFGLPADPETAAQQIVETFERAKRGERVEVGCLGGIGRTGTVLACMAVIAGVPAADAVAWVRQHYRPEAVETSAQSNWVDWFAEWLARDQNTSGARRDE